MSALESALDVLSRAATMVQEEGPKSTELHRRPSNATRRKERQMEPVQDEALAPVRDEALEPVQDEALDMSKGKKAPATFLRPSVITSATTKPSMFYWDKVDSKRRTCNVYDPSVDEHFKRSLGPEKYALVFQPIGKRDEKAVGSSVDDHFAKSLGDQWKALKEPFSRKSMTTPIAIPKNSKYHFPTLKLVCSVCGQTDHVKTP